ncbi:Lrp/AsnC family transcriptional regulator [Haliea sp.]|uniref:Lrp/AsnC family transcriptional regulator n=1 Tax=Haliea sp. TaxID=1932666 RepID=UPI000C5D18E1|nr:Lrp/AsnC family transcriptional regulator [Haliea sp.]MAD61956.1 ArsR family transcriptional regulator [Haliea sp.]MAY91677.1 ArsR family transcriptional regulator [Haliea sp.]MBP69132.1 ArsR family transcriptional regulator [Haliea sp.]
MATHKLDSIDRGILEALQDDSRLSNVELAERVCLSPSPCSRRVRILEEHGFFRGSVMLVDPAKVGLPVSVFVQVSIDNPVRSALDYFEEHVSQWPEVMECYLMTGSFDYLLRVVVPDLAAYQTFLEEKLTPLDVVDSIESSFSLKQVQYKTKLPLGHLGEMALDTDQQ